MPDLTKPPSPAWQRAGVALNLGLAAHLAHKGAGAAAEAALMRAVGVPEPEADMRAYTEYRIANRAHEILRDEFRDQPGHPFHDEL